MEFSEQLDIYLRARFTLMILVSQEEERAVQAILEVCEKSHRPCLSWDLADGFAWISVNSAPPPTAKDPLTALEQIEKSDLPNAIFILKDFHEVWGNPQAKRKIRNISQKLKYTRKSIIITTPSSKIPDELRDEVVTIEFPLPIHQELNRVLDGLTESSGVKINLTTLGKEKLVQAAVGLTSAQAQRVFAKAIVKDGQLDDRDIDLVTQEKKLIIRETEALEYYAVSETPADVGGLGILKEWLRLRERAFTMEARNYGLPAPKGIALIGIPGTGKSLTAKMIGGLWHLPLMRLDVGALFGSLVGESEERTRKALKMAETIAPCVVWIDEMEKGLSQGGMDGGTSMRVFGTILTWMQEKTAPCFVVATANNIASLPPELLRKGRFDEIFFLDLPTFEERMEIFSVHIQKRNRFPNTYDLESLAVQAEGYVGSEIEQAIIDAMYMGFNDNQREFTTADIMVSLQRQVPLSISQRETITMLRNWLREGRAQSASFKETEDAENQFVQIQLDIRKSE
ncbi:MAG: AAA family ATPase [Chloroflexi bacterium HGW-Chloroflexi-10]|nr:MAG: AAA family ATPase [Chloroflexi bacterium HGW-Chloroflexi-10]